MLTTDADFPTTAGFVNVVENEDFPIEQHLCFNLLFSLIFRNLRQET